MVVRARATMTPWKTVPGCSGPPRSALRFNDCLQICSDPKVNVPKVDE